MSSFLGELKRRRVIRVAVAYLIAAWLLAQVADVTFEPLSIPPWASTLVIILLITGFPVALIFAWAFDITPEGIRKTPDAEPEKTSRRSNGPMASIAVLPFQRLTSDSPHAFLADGVALELRNSLSRVHDLRVVSGQSASSHTASDLPSIAATLDVQYVISGSMAESGDKIRLVAQLYDAGRDQLLWSHSYDVRSDDIFAVQQELAESIVGVFGGERLRAEVTRAQSEASTTNLRSWELVQRARTYLIDYKADSVSEAIPLLQRAVRLDPRYAIAHSMLGLVMAEKTLNAISEDPNVDRSAAMQAVRAAEQLSPRDPIVLRAASVVHAYSGDYRGSIDLLRRTVELAPYDLGAWGYFGWPLVATGREDDLRELHGILDHLIEVAPKHPGLGYWLFHKSVAYSCEGMLKDACRFAERSMREQPFFSLGIMNQTNILGRLERTVDARAALGRCTEINPRMTPRYYADLMRVLSDQADVLESRVSGLRAAGLLDMADA